MRLIKFFIVISFILFVYLFQIKNIWAATITVCAEGGCDFSGGGGVVQEAADMANDGDIILIKAGKYVRPNADATPITWSGFGVKSCFVDLKGKNLTLKGEGFANSEWGGTVLFGEGHDGSDTHHPGDASDPYYSRAGICSNGGSVTIDSLHVKEFEGGCMYFKDTKITLKNSLVDGCDHGAMLFSGESSLLTINNYFVVSNIAFRPAHGASIKAINNTIYTKGIDYDCSEPIIPPIDFINNIVIDIEETIGIGGIFSNCQKRVAEFKTQNFKYNLIWKNQTQADGSITEYPCYDREYCDDYVGKITVDPLLNIPATDPRGWRFDGDFSPKAGSPIIGTGDPSIPGPKDIGATGGPCLDSQSSMCLDFIKNNPPRDPLAPVEVNPPVPINPNPIDNINPGTNRFGMPPLLPQFLPKAKLYTAPVINLYNTQKNDKNKDIETNLFMFLVVSGIYIMIMHFAVGVRDFNLMLFILYFGIGGLVGLWFNSWEMGFVASIILSLLFI